MGLFNKLLGYPDADPTGKSRDLFEKVGKQAMTMFFRGDVEKATKHVELFAEQQTNSFGDDHLDVGRASLLAGCMMVFAGKYDLALGMCGVARGVFDDLDKDDMDREAAEFLYEGLDRIISGKSRKAGDYLISPDTPIGTWMLQLKE